MLSRLTSSDLLASIERLASDPSMQTLARRDVRTDDAIKSLRTLINDQRFQKSFQFAQKVCMKCFDDFFCYVLAFRIFLLSKIKNVPKYVAFGYRTIGGGLCSMKYSSKALFGIFLEYQKKKKKQYSLNWVWIGKFWIFPIVIKCALDFLFLPFFQKANNEGHSEVDFFIYQKTVSLEKSAFGKEPNLIWMVSLFEKKSIAKDFLGLFLYVYNL